MSQTSRDRDNSRRVRTHEKNSGETVRRLGIIIQSIFCAQSGAGIRLNFWKWSGVSRYPGALPPSLENFRPTFPPNSTDYPRVSEDGQTGALTAELTGRWFVAHRVSYPQLLWRHQDHLNCGRCSHHPYGSQQILRSIRAFYCYCTLHSQCLFPTTSFFRFLEPPPVLKKRKHSTNRFARNWESRHVKDLSTIKKI